MHKTNDNLFKKNFLNTKKFIFINMYVFLEKVDFKDMHY